MAGQGFDVNLGARTNASQGDGSAFVNSISSISGADKGAANKPAERPAPPPEHLSLLESGIDFFTSKTSLNDTWRHNIDHYGSEFLQTASLFTGGKTGLIATAVAYGLGNAHADDGWRAATVDVGLGAVKGVAMKGLFAVAGAHIALAPTKGIAMGLGSRILDTTVSRDTWNDPSGTWQKLKAQTLDLNQWKYDAMVWTAGEGLMGAGNAMTGSVLNRMPIASGMLAGGTFGAISGGGGEIMREKAAGEKNIDWGKVAKAGAVEAGINAAAAGLGGYVTMAMENSSLKITKTQLITPDKAKKVSFLRINAADTIAPLADDATSPPPQREFIITSGKEDLDAFQNSKAESATVKVREVVSKGANGEQILGDEKSLFVQQLGKKQSALLPAAIGADLVATCHPENLSVSELNNHVFPDAKGHVWLITGDGGDMMLSTGKQALVPVSRMGEFKSAFRLDGGTTTVNVMAPLMIGDPDNPNSKFSQAQMADFKDQLKEAKTLGVTGVSTDVWWGLIQPEKEGPLHLDYYDRISKAIIDAGLDWIPIISFHKCGGNVGDSANVPLPDWIWDDMAKKTGRPADVFKFKSEQGHTSPEYISFFQDKVAQEYYGDVLEKFKDHYAKLAPNIQEVNISLGPAGELRYPSYNSHDQNAGYPTRGSLQMYGPSAVDSLRDFMLKRYGSVDAIAQKWNIPGLTLDRINPPDNPQNFFDSNNQFNTQYGRDLFDWYNQTLIDHGRNTLSTALTKLGGPNSAFSDTDIGAKVAGVHWRVGQDQNGRIVLSDRLAELSAGLIRTSGGDWNSDDLGHGYRPILSMLHDLQPVRVNGHANRIVPFFTCIEIPDGDNGPAVKSLAHTLASWFGFEAKKQGLFLKGENALNGNLHNNNGWDNIDGLMPMPGGSGIYHGVTLLRMEDVVNDPLARARISQLIAGVKSVAPKVVLAPAPGAGAAAAK